MEVIVRIVRKLVYNKLFTGRKQPFFWGEYNPFTKYHGHTSNQLATKENSEMKLLKLPSTSKPSPSHTWCLEV